jgi:hypothetical protein
MTCRSPPTMPAPTARQTHPTHEPRGHRLWFANSAHTTSCTSGASRKPRVSSLLRHPAPSAQHRAAAVVRSRVDRRYFLAGGPWVEGPTGCLAPATRLGCLDALTGMTMHRHKEAT